MKSKGRKVNLKTIASHFLLTVVVAIFLIGSLPIGRRSAAALLLQPSSPQRHQQLPYKVGFQFVHLSLILFSNSNCHCCCDWLLLWLVCSRATAAMDIGHVSWFARFWKAKTPLVDFMFVSVDNNIVIMFFCCHVCCCGWFVNKRLPICLLLLLMYCHLYYSSSYWIFLVSEHSDLKPLWSALWQRVNKKLRLF